MQKRFLIALLLSLSNFLCYADRTNLGVAVLHFDWLTDEQTGYVLSAFFIGYLLTQVLGSHLASTLGGKPVLIAGVSLWTISDLLTVPAASSYLSVLILVRVSMGAGEGVR